MNKTVLKSFATQSRRKLIKQVQTKALLYGIDEKNSLHIEEQFGQLLINGQTYPLSMKPTFTALQKQLEQKGYKQLLEEAAYTWFNRIIAIRYMEVHEYLPERVNVLSSSVGRADPDILFEYDTMDLKVKQDEVKDLLNAGDTEGAYRQLFIAQCNALNSILPFMFEKIQDYTELLLPDFLLDAESTIKVLVQNDELTASFEEIEVIGWLYQYYNEERKNEVINIYKGTIKKEDIPAATQLFTTEWVVRYMVDNSLGRYWIDRNPNSKLQEKLEYFVTPKNGQIQYLSERVSPEELTFFDPCIGSGHILVYAFDVLMEIYRESGYIDHDAVQSIVENNLFGLDIDKRASQLAYFAVMMKARSYDRRFLTKHIQPNITEIIETNNLENFSCEGVTNDAEQNSIGEYLINAYKDAKEIGSLLSIENYDYSSFEDYLNSISLTGQLTMDTDYWYHEILPMMRSLTKQSEIMAKKYTVVCTNPPYMNKLEGQLKKFIVEKYKPYSGDLFSVFIYKNFEYCKPNGYSAFMTPFVWMFIKAYEGLRKYIISEKAITTLVQMEYSSFEEATVPICTFVLKNGEETEKGMYFKLSNFKGGMEIQKQKVLEGINDKNCEYFYETGVEKFSKIPGFPFAFWASNQIFDIFEKHKPLSSIGEARAGMTTGDNNRFLRIWSEVDYSKIGIGYSNAQIAEASRKKWFPYNKGGGFRKWYGLNEMVVLWENNGEQIKNATDKGRKIASVRSERLYFKKSITWATLTSGRFSCRKSDRGFLFDDKGSSAFISDDLFNYTLGMMNSVVSEYILGLLNPTISFQSGNISTLPICIEEKEKDKINSIVESCINNAKEDWDSNETSWDFTQHPFIGGKNIREAFKSWQKISSERFEMQKLNEEELNRIFIEIYELTNDLVFNIEDKQVTLSKADLKRDVKSFISYAIGCMFGRYSLEVPGLAYAGGEWDEDKYSSFKPNKNGVIQLTDSVYFEDDILLRLREFLKVAFSASSVEDNMQWIAEALEMKKGEDTETRLRRYFMDEFFTDHCKLYQKRPIYWLVDSGKQRGLRTLVYMHRYQPDTMATIRFQHLQEIQAKYQQEITDLENRLVNPNLSATDKKKLNAEKVSFEKKIDELREFDKRLAAIAAEEIEIDLDDGVKVNYEKFYRGGKGVLAKIK